MVETIGSTAIQVRSYASDTRGTGSSSGSTGASAAGSSTLSVSDASSNSSGTDPVTKILERYKTVPYLSPRLRVDEAVNRVIVEYRNPDNGDVERQFPSKQQIKQYEAADRAARDASAKSSSTTTSGDVVAATVSGTKPDTVGATQSAPANTASVTAESAPVAESPVKQSANTTPPAANGALSTASRGIIA